MLRLCLQFLMFNLSSSNCATVSTCFFSNCSIFQDGSWICGDPCSLAPGQHLPLLDKAGSYSLNPNVLAPDQHLPLLDKAGGYSLNPNVLASGQHLPLLDKAGVYSLNSHVLVHACNNNPAWPVSFRGGDVKDNLFIIEWKIKCRLQKMIPKNQFLAESSL